MEAFKSLMQDKDLKKILGSILKVGNCLNAGNLQRGQADGFDIEKDLDKVKDI